MMEKTREEICVALLLLLTSVPASASVEVQPSANTATVGDTVTLSLVPPTALRSGSWAVGDALVITWLGEQQAVFPSHSGRASVDIGSGALTLSAVTVADSGVYVVQGSDPPLRASAAITVVEIVSNVTLSVNQTALTEAKSSAILRCSVSSGSSLSFLWLNSSSEVTASDRVHTTDEGSTLIIIGVTRYDQGPFRCHAFNPVSNGTSDPVNFVISYGPDNMALTVNGNGTTSFPSGSNLTMLCSAQSSPPAELGWAIRGEFVSKGPLLEVFGVTEEQTGPYTCRAFNNHTNLSSTITKHILIGEPISNVTLKAQATDLVEFNDSAVFTCSASSGTSVSYAWLNGSSVITGNESVQLSDGGAKLTIVVTRYDQGPFSCNMSNGISHEVSSLVYLKISYGPSNAMMTLQPMKLAYRTGDNITLSCSADSSPAARIWWMFDGMDLDKTGPQLHLQSVTESNSGNYTCMLHNNVTSRFSSESKMIRILSPVTEASVHIVGSQPILNNSFTLTCRTTGTVESITWMHNWSPLYSDETRVLSMDNATLTFSSVMLSDNGNYSCMASNAISNISSQWFMLDIFYGPEKPWILGPVTATIGDNVTLICHAPSNPPSSYKWIFNGSVVADTFTYVTPPFTAEMNGTYTCMAHNNVTGKNSTAHKMITALYPITDVQVEAPKKEAVEGQLYTLTCNVTGPPDLLTVDLNWFKNGHWLQVDNQTTFFTDHKNIMFNPLQKNHSGQYHCSATNAVSAVASPPYLLLVKFGPETPVITGPEFAEIGTTAHFNCSANSYPPSTFTWWFNGSEVANSSMLTTAPLSFNMSGAYTCVAHNDVTGGNRSTTVVLTVVEAIELVITNSSVPIQHENFTLTCEVTGPYEQIYWLKDDMHLNANTSTTNGSMSNDTMSNDTMSNDTMSNHTMSYHIENNTLHFTPVTLYDDGVYKCVASSQVGEHPSAPFSLLVNYGPLSVHISGPGSAHMGSMVTLVCSASSRPDCDFYWYVNNQASILSTGPAITFPALKPYEGNYTCVARNPVTDITLHQSTRFVVVGKSAVLQVPSYGALLLSVFALSLTTFLHGGGLPA
ncbi:Carcinoembryonic antigen-related cell adhesion molecule 5 [Takifugu flavidus]|uniref:Carcinoembryonic antigen-related cell adhesion molecule 5 n=1 Tax=Takifugu flavidus TaxID=433684 RepID=A0A5C6PJS2_9TELE|nr:Carcinoembryonic antigen-related cell adhesion molecule 5 [Takifugu flavidus]